MPVKLTSDQFVAKHSQRTKAAIPDFQAGVAAVTTSPTQQAAAKQDKMIQNLQQAVTSGKWKQRLQAVSLDDWKSATLNKGAGRIAAGVDGAAAKVKSFADQLIPFENSLMDQVNKQPDLTLEDSVNRAATWIRGMSKFTRK